jgi:uncharacterized protein (TIGR02757 family)
MNKKERNRILQILEDKYELYNQPTFIPDDPICIPHQFSVKQDIEIMGFFASVFAWGQRKTIINKCNDLVQRMDGTPYKFIRYHDETDLKNLLGFKHRTFNDTDLLYFVHRLHQHYTAHDSLEKAFLVESISQDSNVKNALIHFKNYFFQEDYPQRTTKHISSPVSGSACKRINMFLRWMVRKDNKGVDFGIWNTIRTNQLICPCDVHVERIARQLGLISRTKADWHTAEELTGALKEFDANDPVKYDFALFGIGVLEKVVG